ncbi:MAG TPA: ComEC/Rec2 family competence protein [Candidatus Saccharimonadales bacterium]|nr:ComEC/Rec2 family competence protein [Candidatus Saccharimonadales bacterium]
MAELLNYFTPSRTFLVFWLALIGGMVAGTQINLSLSLLVWLTALWAVVALSGQEKTFELPAIIFTGLGLGMIIWQLTGGETWLHIGWLATVGGYLTGLRDGIANQIFGALPEPHGSLLVGILFGNRVKLDPTLVKNFQIVGLSHVIAVSGYNLTILGANFRTLLRPILGRKALYFVLAIILVFTLMTGAPASIVRAAIMASLAVVAELLGRPNKSINILVVAAALMAIFEPKIITNIGFQLSVAATYGLLRFSPVIKPLLAKRLPDLIATIISEGTAAILMTAPLIIFYFGRLSVISPITNLLILPLVPLLMGLGLTGCLLIFLVPAIGSFFIQITWPILALIVWLTNYFANLSWASVNVAMPVGGTIIVMAFLVAGVEYLRLLQARVELAEQGAEFDLAAVTVKFDGAI